ncbi:MAG: hypothetical protein ACKVS6_00230 [Planctomycetota bacterium]
MKHQPRAVRRPIRVRQQAQAGVPFYLGIVFSRAVQLAFRGWSGFLMIGVLIYSPLLLLSVCVRFFGDLGTTGVTVVYYLFSVIIIFFGILLAAPVAHGVAQLYQERPVGAGECLLMFARRWKPAVPVVLLTSLAVVFSFAICLVPAFILFMNLATKENPFDGMQSVQTAFVALALLGLTVASARWALVSVAIPSVMVENKSVTDAFARSRELTEHNRGNIAILGAIGIVFCLLVGIAALVIAKTFFAEREQLWIRLVISEIACIVPATFFAILAAVVHQELSKEEAGAEIAKITNIFE